MITALGAALLLVIGAVGMSHGASAKLFMRDGQFVYDGLLEDVVREYAPTKIVTAHLRKTADGCAEAASLADLGRVLHCDDLTVKLEVDRDRVADAAAGVLARLPVADVNIEELDVGSIIERIFRGRGRDDGSEEGSES